MKTPGPECETLVAVAGRVIALLRASLALTPQDRPGRARPQSNSTMGDAGVSWHKLLEQQPHQLRNRVHHQQHQRCATGANRRPCFRIELSGRWDLRWANAFARVTG